MKVRSARALNFFAKKTTCYLGLFTFLTLGLTNCGKSGPSNDISLELEEDFPTDDISALPLEEQDLVDLSNKGPQHYLIDAEPHLLHHTSIPTVGRLSQSFNYSKEAKTFTVKQTTEIQSEETTTTQILNSTYSSQAPFELIKASRSQKAFSVKAGVSSTESVTFEINCAVTSCSIVGDHNGIPLNRQLHKNVMPIEGLKEVLIDRLVARHKYPATKIRLNTFEITATGITKTKRIYFFNNTESEAPLEVSEISKSFNPFADVKYSLSKTQSLLARSGEYLAINVSPLTFKKVHQIQYDGQINGKIKSTVVVEFVAPVSKTFQSPTVILTGNARYNVKNTSLQSIEHFSEHSEVKLFSSPGERIKTAPTQAEITLDPKYVVDPEWKKELDVKLVGLTSTHDKADAIHNFLIRKIRYSNVDSPLSFTELFEFKKGDCSEFAKSFVLFARHYGIPARKRVGSATSKNLSLDADNNVLYEGGLHAWAEYYNPEAGGWVYIDGSLRAHGHNNNFYIFDFDEDSQSDLIKEDYSNFANLSIHFVFDEASRKLTAERFTKPGIFAELRKLLSP